MTRTLLVLPLILMIPNVYAQSAGNSADGKQLHDANCMGCHDAGIYSRKDRVVRSLDELKRQLDSCNHLANKEFSATETQNILKYLNDRFYHFH